jgi:hypothetical protein
MRVHIQRSSATCFNCIIEPESLSDRSKKHILYRVLRDGMFPSGRHGQLSRRHRFYRWSNQYHDPVSDFPKELTSKRVSLDTRYLNQSANWITSQSEVVSLGQLRYCLKRYEETCSIPISAAWRMTAGSAPRQAAIPAAWAQCLHQVSRQDVNLQPWSKLRPLRSG